MGCPAAAACTRMRLVVCPPGLPGRARTVVVVRARRVSGTGGGCHPVLETVRRLARARSRTTAAVAAARAAATAIRVICQPGMPRAAIIPAAGAGAGPYGPPPGTGMIEAEAAGTAPAQPST